MGTCAREFMAGFYPLTYARNVPAFGRGRTLDFFPSEAVETSQFSEPLGESGRFGFPVSALTVPYGELEVK